MPPHAQWTAPADQTTLWRRRWFRRFDYGSMAWLWRLFTTAPIHKCEATRRCQCRRESASNEAMRDLSDSRFYR
jgi:hypothetical protein